MKLTLLKSEMVLPSHECPATQAGVGKVPLPLTEACELAAIIDQAIYEASGGSLGPREAPRPGTNGRRGDGSHVLIQATSLRNIKHTAAERPSGVEGR